MVSKTSKQMTQTQNTHVFLKVPIQSGLVLEKRAAICLLWAETHLDVPWSSSAEYMEFLLDWVHRVKHILYIRDDCISSLLLSVLVITWRIEGGSFFSARAFLYLISLSLQVRHPGYSNDTTTQFSCCRPLEISPWVFVDIVHMALLRRVVCVPCMCVAYFLHVVPHLSCRSVPANVSVCVQLLCDTKLHRVGGKLL